MRAPDGPGDARADRCGDERTGPRRRRISRLRENEFRGEDFIAFRWLALSERHAATLSQATDGVLERASATGRSWARTGSAMSCARRSSTISDVGARWRCCGGADREPFWPAHAALVDAVTRELAEGLRRAVLIDRDAPGPQTARTCGGRRACPGRLDRVRGRGRRGVD